MAETVWVLEVKVLEVFLLSPSLLPFHPLIPRSELA